MQTLSQIIDQYKQLLETNDSLAIIERFYADDIVQVENNEAPVTGKETILALEKKNMDGVNWFTLKIDKLVVDEKQGLVMGEMDISFDSKKYGKKKLKEAFVQHWVNGKITYQKFYYKEILSNNE